VKYMSLSNRHKILIAVLFLITIITLFLFSNIHFIKKDAHRFSDWQIVRALMYYDRIFVDSNVKLSQIPYPPVAYFVTSLFFKFGGISQQIARISISFFAIIFLLAMFGIGYELGGYYGAATVTALAAASPHIINISRIYYLEFPQTAMTALAFYLLLKTGGFKNRKYSILFGIALALSFLTKWSTAFFMVIPVLWFLIPILFKKGHSIKTWLGFIIPTIITVLGVIWYFRQTPTVIPHNADPSLKWLLYFMLIVVIPGVLSVASLLYIEIKKRKDESYKTSGSSLLTNFAFFSVAFAFVESPWFFHGAILIKQKCLKDIMRYDNFALSLEFLKGFFVSAFNLYPVFLILPLIGIIFIFLRDRKKLYQRLLIPVNIVFATLIMFWIFAQTHSPRLRYLISLIIFLAALGGYWVMYLGRARIAVTALIVVVSFLSFLHGFIPVKNIFFTIQEYGWRGELPIAKILCPCTVDKTGFHPDRLIEILPCDENKQPYNLLMMEFSREGGFNLPEHRGRYMRIGKKDMPGHRYPRHQPHPFNAGMIHNPALTFRTSAGFYHPRLAELVWLESFRQNKNLKRFQPGERTENFVVVIFYRSGIRRDTVREHALHHFSITPQTTKSVDIGGGFRVIIIEYKVGYK